MGAEAEAATAAQTVSDIWRLAEWPIAGLPCNFIECAVPLACLRTFEQQHV